MARILIIEDNPALLPVLAELLTASGHAVRTARNGAEGLIQFRADPPDLVLTDIVMPEQDGVGVLLELRKLRPRPKIIAMSGGTVRSSQYLQMAAGLGARRVLEKPFSNSVLLQAINEVLAEPVDPSTAPTKPA